MLIRFHKIFFQSYFGKLILQFYNNCMNDLLNPQLAEAYLNQSQKVRIMTESWVLSEIYCPNCGNSLLDYEKNRPVADFYCQKCKEDFELKSKSGKFSKKISAGAYSKMIERLRSTQKPNFFFMAYFMKVLRVNDFFVVPKHFITPNLVEKRNPLQETAKRAGWIGSNLLFAKIPKAGQIYYVRNGITLDKHEVMEKWQKTIFLKNVHQNNAKGWILDIMNCIDAIQKDEFELKDLYKFEEDLARLHPKNKNIKPKIRQQLQFLRDKGYLEFLEIGKYRLK